MQMPELTIKIHGTCIQNDSQVQRQHGAHAWKMNTPWCCGLPGLPEWPDSASFPLRESNHGLKPHLKVNEQQNGLHSWPSQRGFEERIDAVINWLTSDDSRDSPPSSCKAWYHDVTGSLVDTKHSLSAATLCDPNELLEPGLAELETINGRRNVIPRCTEFSNPNEPGQHQDFVSGLFPSHTSRSGSGHRRESPTTKPYPKSVATPEASGGEDVRKPPSIHPIGGGGES